MSNETKKEGKGFMQSLAGIRQLKNDKIDVYQSTPRKKHVIKAHKDFTDPVSEFNPITHNIPETSQHSWFHHGVQKKLQRKIKSGQLNIYAILDLHGHRKHQATRELESFMRDAINMQSRMVLIIHGKGFNSESEAVLRPLVQHWLSEQSVVLAYCPAQPKDGGSGASYVYLKNQRG
ncbi:MAG: hypothetical protein HOC92_00540 [Gammaproteobacteria bacterium]|nr:hypothetical protein [Gammaproteobacteria bacterium]